MFDSVTSQFTSFKPLLLLVLGFGCAGGTEQPSVVTVTGTITFQGQPVERGDVTFENSESGVAATGPIVPGGMYTLTVIPGSYKVGITPPTTQGTASDDTPADFVDYEKVDNIPNRYYWGGESGLSATVSAESLTHSFDMKAE